MNEIIRLTQSPFEPAIKEACGLIFNVSAPYNKECVTILINPSLVEYKEDDSKDNIQVKQLMAFEHTQNTKSIFLSERFHQSVNFNIDEKEYNIKLIQIGTEIKQGQDFFFFEISVSII